MGATIIKNIQMNKSSESFIFSSFITQTQQFVSRLNSNFNQSQLNAISSNQLKNNQVFQVDVPCANTNLNQEKQQQITISRKTNINSLYNESKKNYKGKIDLTCRRQKSKHCVEYMKKKYIVKKLVATYQNFQVISQMLSRSGLKNNKLHINSIINSRIKNIVSLIGFDKESLSFMCGDNWQFTLIFQYFGEYTLLNQINLRSSEILSKTLKFLPGQDLNLLHQYSFKMSQILAILKFLLQTSQQLLSYTLLSNNQSGLYPKICLNDVIILQNYEKNILEKKSFKYRNPLESIYFHHRQTITKNNYKHYKFSNLQANRSTFTQQPSHTTSRMICHIGICILSLCLLEQCQQQCCNSAGELCISVVQKKIEEVFQLYCLDNDEKIVRRFCNMIELFILQGTNQYRMSNNVGQISIGQAKAKCNKLFIEQKHKVLKIMPSFSPNSVTNTNYTQLVLQSQQQVSQAPKLLKKTTQKSQTVSTNILGHVNMNNKKQFCSEYFSIGSTHQYRPIKSHSTNKIKTNQENVQANQNIMGNKLTSFRYSYNKRKNEQRKDKIDWNINPSSQKKIQAVNMLQPRTRQWIIQQHKNISSNSPQFTKNRDSFKKRQSQKIKNKEPFLKNHQRYQSFDQIDRKWRQDEELFKNMPEFQQNQQSLFTIAGSSSIRLSGDILSYRQSINNNNLA